jgi:hypothetical protein
MLHATQTLEPVTAAKKPAPQLVQNDSACAPVDGWKKPAAHDMHSVDSAFGW